MIVGAIALTLSVPSPEYFLTTSNHIAVAAAFCTVSLLMLTYVLTVRSVYYSSTRFVRVLDSTCVLQLLW